MVTDTTPAPTASAASTALRIARGIGFLLAALLLVAALYYWFVPAQVASREGVFGCGTAASPPTDGFAKGACQRTADVHAFRTYALLGSALVLALGSYLLFRGERDDEWDDEDVELSGTAAGSARGGRERFGRTTGRDRRDRRDNDEERPARGSRAARPSEDADADEARDHRRPGRSPRAADRAEDERGGRRNDRRESDVDDDWERDGGRGSATRDDDLFGDEDGGSSRPGRLRSRRDRHDDF